LFNWLTNPFGGGVIEPGVVLEGRWWYSQGSRRVYELEVD
jgi:hypothetical protein